MRSYTFEEKDPWGYPLGTYVGHIRTDTDYLYYGTASYNCPTAAKMKVAIVMSRIEKKNVS